MKAELDKLRDSVLVEIAKLTSAGEMEALRARCLGRKGVLKELTQRIPSLPEADRPVAGKLANEVKKAITAALEAAAKALADDQTTPGGGESFDVTLPGKRPRVGALHPITSTIREIREIFASLGFEVAYGPEVELEWYNFDALNIPADHPARDGFDTFYLENGALLRSQTSTVQIRVMEKRRPPIRVIAPGKVFRPDTVDASHLFMFNQVEGLMVDENVTFADLRHALHEFLRAFFGPAVSMRMRPSFFPFTEPSAEVDVSCIVCGGKGCGTCGQKGWIEVLGSGMVDPSVLEAVGYDADKYTGFAFGMGVERLTMLRYGINDIRLLIENDVRFLQQFGGTL